MDWRSAVRDFENGRSSSFVDKFQEGEPERFVDRLHRQQDLLRAQAVQAAKAGIQINDKNNETTTNNHTFLKAPPDQFVEFSVPFLSPPNTGDLNSTTTVILVPSHQGSFVKRQAIRETWKTPTASTTILFVIAHSNFHEFDMDMGLTANSETTPCEVVDNFLRLEQQLYHDLLEIPMVEDYTLLSEKILQAYHWAMESLPNLKWFAKADDDMFVNVQKLEGYLDQYNPNVPTVIGEIVVDAPVHKEGKWADRDYPRFTYPNWAKGSAGHVLSRATVDYLTRHSESLHRYQGEDTNIGIWLDEATQDKSLEDVTFIDARDRFISYGYQACLKPSNAIMIGHELKPDDQERCQNTHKPATHGIFKLFYIVCGILTIGYILFR